MFNGQTANDRPDLICRVFKRKLDEFLDQIINKQIFGRVKAYVWVIEFQKRGLPHCHLLLILDENDKIDSVEKIDQVISAEIPDKKQHPRLYELVLKHMIHMPCTSVYRKCKKGKGNQCNKRFPKSFQDKTTMDEDSYPFYRRRKTAPIKYMVNRSKCEIDNRYVVPYNKYLLLKFNCHVNVEVCNTIQAVKYLYKYVYKGYDKSLVELKDNDEIKQYINSRYVSSVEAYWRLMEYKTHSRYPVVVRLPIHLENAHNVCFDGQDDINKLLKEKRATKLTEWFESNKKYKNEPLFSHIKYYKYPHFFTWRNNQKKWAKRVKNYSILKRGIRNRNFETNSQIKMNEDIVVRTHNVPVQNTEQYFLKTILYHQSGAQSFSDLRVVNGIQYDTYRNTALQLGLLNDDEIWRTTLNEAVLINCSSYKLRQLFSYMLLFCEINDTERLWNEFNKYLGDDFKRQTLTEDFQQKVLLHISEILFEHNRTLEDYNLPKLRNPMELKHSLFSQVSNQHLLKFDSRFLNSAQKKIFDHVFEKLYKRDQSLLNEIKEQDNLIFIDAPGGTGKTYLLNSIIINAIKEEFIVLSVASTGLASILLHNGRTSHSTFKLPIQIDEDKQMFCDIKKNSQLANFLKTVDLIIWDECSMTSKYLLECFERTLRDICEVDTLFGEKIIILSGDFRQTLPIVRNRTNGMKTATLRHCIKYSWIWEHVTIFNLSTNLRLRKYPEFSEYILKIGEDKIPKNENDEIQLKSELLFENHDLNAFLEFYFDTKLFHEGNQHYYENTAILTPLNEDVHFLNSKILERFKSKNDEKIYLSKDIICKECQNLNVSEELLNSINQSGLPNHKLELKTGAIVFLLRNLNPNQGLCNGTRILITALHENLIIGEILNGKLKGCLVEIPRIELYSDDQQTLRFKRRQFPVRLAFVMSISKAQGQTLHRVGIYLVREIFGHGQLYVALSRGDDPKEIKVFLNANQSVHNIVYNEILI